METTVKEKILSQFVNRFNPKSASGCIASDTIHGSPAAWASSNTNPNPSNIDGNTNTSILCNITFISSLIPKI